MPSLTWLSLSLRAAQGGDVVMFHGGHLPHRVVGTTAGTTTPAFRAMCGGAGFDRINMQVSAKRERERERERGGGGGRIGERFCQPPSFFLGAARRG